MNLFYLDTISENASEAVFDKEESRHITKVLRYKEGDSLHLTNGKGILFKGTIASLTPKQCIVKIVSSERQTPLPYYLHMAVAPTKQNDRYEWFLEKATEIGISEITPIICEHSERKVVKTNRYEKIIESAMKQSLSCYKPILNEPISFSEFIKNATKFQGEKCIAHCEPSEKQLLNSIISPKQKVLILIGPEGDFSPSEIHMALQQQFSPINLGTSRLRTETAAITACHSISFINLR